MLKLIKSTTFWGALVALLVSAFTFGVFLGYNERPEVKKITELFNQEVPLEPSFVNDPLDFSSFWEVWRVLKSKHVANEDLDEQKMVWGAISGLVSSLGDPYSVFFPPQESEMFKSAVRGDFGGVGMEIGIRDNLLTVIAPLKDTPAWRAGILGGDKIIEIDGKSTLDFTLDELVEMIRGEKGTTVSFLIVREGESETLQIEVERDTIVIPSMETEQKENGIFVIRVYSFANNATVDFREALRKMVDGESSKLIIDLRGNPGGYLEAAVDMSSWFLPTGKIVARERFSSGNEILHRSKGYNIFKNLPLVVLIDQGSASASEIMAGALKEHGVATLVGETSFGKGSVQELVDIDGGGSLKVTVARWLTPEEISISEGGLEPDVKVEITKEDIENKYDSQMEKALEILKDM